jgi:hypothetical protein
LCFPTRDDFSEESNRKRLVDNTERV